MLKQLNIQLDEKVIEFLKINADQLEMSVSCFVRKLLREHLGNNNYKRILKDE